MQHNLICIIACIILFQYTQTTIGKRRCQSNAVFKTCGTACPKRCSDKSDLKPCTKQCVARCECRDGYVLNAKNRCIPKSKCPRKPSRKCYNNRMRFSNCPNREELRCSTINGRPNGKPNKKPCGIPRCVCKRDFVNIDGDCFSKLLCYIRTPIRSTKKSLEKKKAAKKNTKNTKRRV